MRSTDSGGLDQATVPVSSWKDFVGFFSCWSNAKLLLGTTLSWLLLDVVFYGFQLNITLILRKSNFDGFRKKSRGEYGIYDLLLHNALVNLVLVCAGAIPGYLLTVFTVRNRPVLSPLHSAKIVLGRQTWTEVDTDTSICRFDRIASHPWLRWRCRQAW